MTSAAIEEIQTLYDRLLNDDVPTDLSLQCIKRAVLLHEFAGDKTAKSASLPAAYYIQLIDHNLKRQANAEEDDTKPVEKTVNVLESANRYISGNAQQLARVLASAAAASSRVA